MDPERNRVCPVELADSLDSKVRRWLQNPQSILSPFVKEGMRVLDVGCGPGFFSIEIARMVGRTGTVVSVDMQQGMLDKLRSKITGTGLESRIQLVKCDQDALKVNGQFDFILTFYMVHEVPDKNSFFRQLRNLLADNGQYLLVEPKLFHVSRDEFEATTRLAETNGFSVGRGPKLLASWSAILTNS